MMSVNHYILYTGVSPSNTVNYNEMASLHDITYSMAKALVDTDSNWKWGWVSLWRKNKNKSFC